MTDSEPLQAPAEDPVARLSLLSEGQLDVLALVAEHRSSKEIARVLGISQHTVDQRMKRVQTLMGVTSRLMLPVSGPQMRTSSQGPAPRYGEI